MLTAAEMAATDKRTAQGGVLLATLMENAGGAVARFVRTHYRKAERVLVICGKGNNGGDGFVAARHLEGDGRKVKVLLLADPAGLSGEAADAFASLQAERRVKIYTAKDEAELEAEGHRLVEADVIVDAVLGTGFKPPLRGLAALLRTKLAEMTTRVVAVDLPSGWDADSMEETSATAFRADAVVTFTAPKPAHLFGHLTIGPVVVAEIGSPVEAVRSGEKIFWAGTAKTLAEAPRAINSNKGKFGHVLVVGGAWGKAGAPGMASLAALRTGAGLVTAAVPESIVNTVAGVTPELMLAPLLEVEGGTIAAENLKPKRLAALLKKISVVAVGPGLGTEGEATEFVHGLVAQTAVPMVIDADALNAFAGKTNLLSGRGRFKGRGKTLVLTPHPGEMARLLGISVKAVEADRVGLARAFAKKHQVTLVLKGWRTLIAHSDGRVAVNTTGNAGMAKGGSGDILTGIVAAMLAQYPEHVAEAVEAAVYLHGLAGDFATHAQDEHTVLATDTLEHLRDAFRYRVKDEDGLVWLCGLRG
ncbi:MAG TPA: NAD(P)H-hydrate dehydratase [Acidobacteriaceae bacterium]